VDTLIEQLAAAARELGQLFFWEKSAELAPVMAILVIASGTLPVLVSIVVWTVTKVNDVADNLIAGEVVVTTPERFKV
jgi:hypothetical protein